MINPNMNVMTKQILLTSAVLVFAVLLFDYSSIDLWVQRSLYNVETRQWFWDRNETVSRLIFYDGAKTAFIVFTALLPLALVVFRKSQIIREYKRGIVIVFLSSLFVPSVVGTLKAVTNVPCPKNISLFGGTYPYVTVLKSYPNNFHPIKKIRCYPAGHASAGFALLSLYFLFKSRRNKRIALGFALTAGWSMGTYKMLIGDHFLSHTVVTMIVAWLIILLTVSAVTMRYPETASHTFDLP